MLVVTKKYELVEVNVIRCLLLLVFITLAIAGITALASDIPESINMAISIPLSLVATIVWELTFRKRNRICDEEGVELLLTKIAEGDEEFVQGFLDLSSRRIKLLRLS